MCGIAGIWYRNRKPVKKPVLNRMLDVMAHRGREGTGYYVQGDIGLAHNRMRVIDLSDDASQPMSGVDGRYQLIFNGEIHNYKELRHELTKKGWVFRSESDTEVVLASFVCWGTECFNRFNGMWGIAIWDNVENELIISRDWFGIKPVLYAFHNEELVFASEAKAILAATAQHQQTNFSTLYGYLTTGATNFGVDTFHQNIKALQPGSFLRITRDKVQTTQYWSFRPGTESPIENAKEQFRELLIDATRIRLRSDVSMASWLSGGLDSSVVTRIAGSIQNKSLQCYSLRYSNPADDESSYAAAVADDEGKYPMQWVTPEKCDPIDVIKNIVHHHDGPTPMRGRYAMWHIAQQTAGNQVVVLNGDGADEILGGYGFFTAPYFLDRLRNWRSHRNDELGIFEEIGQLSAVQARSRLSTLRMLVTPWLFRYGAQYHPLADLFTQSFKHDFGYWNASQHQSGWACKHNDAPYKSALNNALWHEFTQRGLPELLHGSDAISMAHTLETRSPFLDHRVVEFCFSLPYNEKISGGYTKRLIRTAFSDMLPKVVRDRKEKFGFRSPIGKWLLEPNTFRQATEMLNQGECVKCGILDQKKLGRQLKSIHTKQDPSNGETLWRWLSTELWMRKFTTADDTATKTQR